MRANVPPHPTLKKPPNFRWKINDFRVGRDELGHLGEDNEKPNKMTTCFETNGE